MGFFVRGMEFLRQISRWTPFGNFSICHGVATLSFISPRVDDHRALCQSTQGEAQSYLTPMTFMLYSAGVSADSTNTSLVCKGNQRRNMSPSFYLHPASICRVFLAFKTFSTSVIVPDFSLFP